MASKQQQAQRDRLGRFIQGSAGGPGRPARAIESDYLRALSDRLSLETWGEICDKAIEQAKEGEPKAREWLSRYAIGAEPLSLLELAANEALGLSSVYAVAARMDALTHPDERQVLNQIALGIASPEQRALQLVREFPPADPGESET